MRLAPPISALIYYRNSNKINSARTSAPTSPRVSIISIRKKSKPISEDTIRLQKTIWAEAIEATTISNGSHSDGARLLLPALNQMFDIANTRKNTFNLHPPMVVYLLLFTQSCGCAFFAGYNMQDRNPLHIWPLHLLFR